MRLVRNITIGFGALVVLIVVVLLALPLFFRDTLNSRAKAEVNKAVNARVAWNGVGLSLIRDFPNVSLTLDGTSIIGNKPFEADTLLSMRKARVVLDAMSVVRYLRSNSAIVVREFVFDQPVVRLRKLADGAANWDIARPSTSAETQPGSSLNITLRDLRITDADITLDDRQSNLSGSIKGLDESLRGDFSKDKFGLSTRTHADTVSLTFGGVPYLSRVGLDLNANVDADLPAHRFTLTNDSLRLNTLVLALAGTVVTGKPNITLDLTFSAPSRSFSEILSLVPAIYARDFARLQTSGSLALSGKVNGQYGPQAFPALALRANVNNGSFRYPDLALPAKDISFDLAIDNPGGHPDKTVVDLRRFHAMLGQRSIDAKLTVRTPISDPDVDVRLTGALDLADLRRTVKLEKVTDLAGVVTADVAMRARVSDVNSHRYDQVAASGSMQASHIAILSAAIPHPVAIDTAALRFTPRTAEVTTFAGTIGGSDVRATASLDNLLGFVLHDEDLRGTATLNSNRFDLNEWRSKEKTTEVIPVPSHVDFMVNASAARVTYGTMTAANVRGDLKVKDQRVTLHNLQMEMLRGSIVANGFYETVNVERPAFGMDFRVTSLDIPLAFAALSTVQKFAPIAKWAQGNVSGTIALNGLLGRDMTPVFSALSGKGAVETDRLVLQSAPVLEKLSTMLSFQQLKSPGLGSLRASFDVADGRLHVKPFAVAANGINMTVSGSNGIDQTLSYDMALAVPRTLLGPAATSAITKLATQAGKVGVDLSAGEIVQLLARVGGTVTSPTITTNFTGMAASARDAAQNAAKQVVAAGTETVKQKVDSVADEATRRARAEADRLIAEATRQADTIRAGARTLADKIRREGYARIDSLVARATNPIAKIAAEKSATRLRSETDQQADRVVREAGVRADALIAAAKQKADSLVMARP
jgi:hypothetical protein